MHYMNLFVFSFMQVNIANLGKAVNNHRYIYPQHICGSFCADTAVANSALRHGPQCPVDYNTTCTYETLQLLFLKAAPVSIKDVWPIFCFSWAPQITRHIHKCAKYYASFLTFHLWAALSFLPTGQLKVTFWQPPARPCAAAVLSCHRRLRN